MRRALLALLLLALPAVLHAQNPAPPNPAPGASQQPYTIRTESNVVLMPTQIETKKGEILYGLKPEQFVVEDNGIAQQVRVDEDTDALGLSLVVLVQCSRSAGMEYGKLRGLATMIDAIAGDAPREVALVRYGDGTEVLGDFTNKPDRINVALNDLQPCDDAPATTLDAVSYATTMLEGRNNHYRHAILLISETRDHGSKIKASKIIADLGRTNTVVDSVSFSPGKNEAMASLFHGQMGPGAIGLLIAAVEALKKNVPKTLASLSGGEYQTFSSQKDFDNNLHQLSNHIHNYYLLSFQPHAGPQTMPGLHSLRVKIPDYPDARIRTRESYYSGTLDPPPEP
jgi:VWFA-related protein